LLIGIVRLQSVSVKSTVPESFRLFGVIFS